MLGCSASDPSLRDKSNVVTEARASATQTKVLFFGWKVVGFTATAQFFSVGIGYYTFGVYLKPLTEALGATRFEISLAISLQMVLMAVFSPFAVRLLTEHSLRLMMLIGVGLLSLGLVIASMATSIWQLYLGFSVVVGVGVGLTSNLACNLILTNWFTRRRGTALGLSQAGITFSGVVLVPLATWLLTTFGWQTSFLVFAVLTPLVLGPLIWRFAIRAPEDVGLTPDGEAPVALSLAEAGPVEWTFARAVRNRDVWLISLIAGPCYMAIAAIVIALPSHGTDLGLSPMHASWTVLVTTLFGAIAKPLAGASADHIPKRLVVTVAVALQVVATLLLLIADDLLMLCLAGALFGLGYGGIAPLWSLLLAERFGVHAFAKVMGASMPLTMPFNLVGLPLTTLVFGMTGSYLPAFAMLLIGYAVSAVCLWLLRLPGEMHFE